MKLLLLVNTITCVYCVLVSVKIKEGEVIGKTYTLDNNREVYAFLGVPYAEPPIGEDRFKKAKQLKPWEGAKMATAQGNICLQVPYAPGHEPTPIGNEDCLYMNIFTPKLPTDNVIGRKMNVFVYIHGGAFMFGAGNEAYPDYMLANNDIVFVAFNYRLGPFGFLATENPSAPGNYGLHDQIEALRWVRRNIRYFGGNPDKVTIYGCSSGGASIHYHMISPQSEGLFQSGISSSGSLLNPWVLPSGVVKNSRELASSLGCNYENIEMMMYCMRAKPANEIVEKAYKYGETGHLTNALFGPVVEPKHARSFLSENPHVLLKAGKVKHLPWLMGFVETEGSFLAIEIESNNTYMDYVNNHWYKMAPQLFSYSYDRSNAKQDHMSDTIKKHYLKGQIITKQNVKTIFQAVGDRHIHCGATEALKLHSSAVPNDLFCFKFYYRGAESASDLYPDTNKKNYGVCHCDDLSYIVKYGDGKSKNKNDSDMTKLLTSSIIAFMETGNPSTAEIEWKPLSKKGKMNCLVIYSYTYQRMEDIENRKDNRFWKRLGACEG